MKKRLSASDKLIIAAFVGMLIWAVVFFGSNL